MLSLRFEFHAEDHRDVIIDLESRHDVIGFMLLIRLDWRVLKLDAGKLIGRLLVYMRLVCNWCGDRNREQSTHLRAIKKVESVRLGSLF